MLTVSLSTCGSGADLRRLDIERRVAFLAVPLGEPVRGQPPHRGTRPHVDAPAMLGGGQALILEHPQRVADGHPGHAVVLHQLRLRRQLLTLPQPGPADRIPQMIRDLLIHRPVRRRVDHLRQYAVTGHRKTPQLVYMSSPVCYP